MTTLDPYNFPQAWDTIQIGIGVWGGPTGFFGKIQIKGATRFYKIDQKDGGGLDGATQTYRGVKPKSFKLIFSWGFQGLTAVSPSQQHAYWAFFSNQFLYTGSKGLSLPPVYPVSHPALALLQISTILVEEVGQVEVDFDTKISSATVVVRQFYPPPPTSATTTPIGTGDANVSGYIPGVPQQSALNASLLAQIQQQRAIGEAGTTSAFPY